MESKIKASFIPKKPVAQQSPTASMRYKSGGLDLMMLVAIVLIAVATVLSVGVFLYKSMAQQESKNKIKRLQQAKDSFDPQLIKRMQKLSTRIQVAQSILDNHIAPSLFLYALERDTLTGVQFTEFKFKPKNNDIAEFNLKGKTGSVNSVALQSSRFSDSEIIKTSIFSDIDLINGGVTFNVAGEIDLNALRFANAVNGAFGRPTPQTETTDTLFDSIINDVEQPSQDSPVDFGAFGNFE